MSALEPRHLTAQLRRLQTLLVLMILWDLLALMAEFSFGSGLMRIDDNQIDGFLGARTSMAGAPAVTIAVYFYGLVRNPMRHRGVVWVAIVAQAAAAFFAVFHVAANHVTIEGAVLPLVASLLLLFLLIVNLPRGEGYP